MFEKKENETKEEREARIEREKEREIELKENNPEFFRLFKTEMLKSEGETEMKLYRVVKRGKKRIKEFVNEYHCEIPTETEIGNEFGGGLFWAIGWDEDGKEHMTYIRISEHFTKLKEKREQQQALMIPQNQKGPLENMTEIFAVMKPIFEMLVKSTNKNVQQDTPRIVETLIESYSKSMQKVQTAMFNQKLEHIEEMGKKPKLPPPDKMSWVKDVVDMAKPFVNGFLTSNGAVQNMMKKALFKNPDFKEIKDDDLLFKYMYTLMVQDPDIGPEKAADLFEKAGFEVPNFEDPEELEEEKEDQEQDRKESIAAGDN